MSLGQSLRIHIAIYSVMYSIYPFEDIVESEIICNMEKSPSREVNRFAVCQEIPLIL